MGMFDTVVVECPSCQRKLDFQSKAGKCNLQKYVLADVPIAIAEDLDTTKRICICGESIILCNPNPRVLVRMHITDKLEKDNPISKVYTNVTDLIDFRLNSINTSKDVPSS